MLDRLSRRRCGTKCQLSLKGETTERVVLIRTPQGVRLHLYMLLWIPFGAAFKAAFPRESEELGTPHKIHGTILRSSRKDCYMPIVLLMKGFDLAINSESGKFACFQLTNVQMHFTSRVRISSGWLATYAGQKRVHERLDSRRILRSQRQSLWDPRYGRIRRAGCVNILTTLPMLVCSCIESFGVCKLLHPFLITLPHHPLVFRSEL